jgi:hypothetical protein
MFASTATLSAGSVTLDQVLGTAEGLCRKFAALTPPAEDPPGLLVTYDGQTMTGRLLPDIYTRRQKALVTGILVPQAIAADAAETCVLAVPMWTSSGQQGGRGLRWTGVSEEVIGVFIATASGRERVYHMPIIRRDGEAPVLGWSLPVAEDLSTGTIAAALRHGLGCFAKAELSDDIPPTPQRPRVSAYRFADGATADAARDALAATSLWGPLTLVGSEEPASQDEESVDVHIATCVAETLDELIRFRAVLDEFGQRIAPTESLAINALQSRCLLTVLNSGGMPTNLHAELASHEAPRRAPRVGRNDACVCGSGRKSKRCCAG